MHNSQLSHTSSTLPQTWLHLLQQVSRDSIRKCIAVLQTAHTNAFGVLTSADENSRFSHISFGLLARLSALLCVFVYRRLFLTFDFALAGFVVLMTWPVTKKKKEKRFPEIYQSDLPRYGRVSKLGFGDFQKNYATWGGERRHSLSAVSHTPTWPEREEDSPHFPCSPLQTWPTSPVSSIKSIAHTFITSSRHALPIQNWNIGVHIVSKLLYCCTHSAIKHVVILFLLPVSFTVVYAEKFISRHT